MKNTQSEFAQVVVTSMALTREEADVIFMVATYQEAVVTFMAATHLEALVIFTALQLQVNVKSVVVGKRLQMICLI